MSRVQKQNLSAVVKYYMLQKGGNIYRILILLQKSTGSFHVN